MIRGPVPGQAFAIHEDAPTDEAEMIDESEQRTEEVRPESEGAVSGEEGEEEEPSDETESSDDEVSAPDHVAQDMEKLQRSIPGFKEKYRLIKRIGEGLSFVAHGRTFE